MEEEFWLYDVRKPTMYSDQFSPKDEFKSGTYVAKVCESFDSSLSSSTLHINLFLSDQIKCDHCLANGAKSLLLLTSKKPPLVNKAELQFQPCLLVPSFQMIFLAIHAKIKTWPLPAIAKGISHVSQRVHDMLLDFVSSSTATGSNVLDINVKFSFLFNRFLEKPFDITPNLTMETRNRELHLCVPAEFNYPGVSKAIVTDDEYNRCPICLENFLGEVGFGLGPELLQCGHAFHYDCVAVWFQRSRSCPLCRLVVSNYST